MKRDEQRTAPKSLRTRLGVVAGLLVVLASAWWFTRDSADDAAGLGELRVSHHEQLDREGKEARFRSGEEVYLHFRSARAGQAMLISFPSDLELSLSNEEPYPVQAGANRLGPFSLNERPGRDSYFVAFAPVQTSLAEINSAFLRARENVAFARRAAANDSTLYSIVRGVLGEAVGWQTRSVRFEHLP